MRVESGSRLNSPGSATLLKRGFREPSVYSISGGVNRHFGDKCYRKEGGQKGEGHEGSTLTPPPLTPFKDPKTVHDFKNWDKH